MIRKHSFTSKITRCRPLLPPTAPEAPIEVKCRGHLPHIDTDHLQKTWSRPPGKTLTILIFRHCKETVAAIASRDLKQ